MRWHDLLFAHWPMPPAELRPALPPGLELDLFDGAAWLGVIPFHMTGVRPRFVPALPWFSAFPELNVRTYVTWEGKPGVYFFSLDAGNRAAVTVARRWYHLPYFHAAMRSTSSSDSIDYTSRRTHPGAGPAEFRARYRPCGEMFLPARGTREYFLAERYCLYVGARPHGALGAAGQGRATGETLGGNRLYRGEIHHAAWRLQPADAEIQSNTMVAALGFRLPERPPLLHFARHMEVLAWPLSPVQSVL